MVALKKSPLIPADVVMDATVMGGQPVVRGTRVPAATIIAYLNEGRSHVEIFEDYPTLPVDGIEAVVDWARGRFGTDWMRAASADLACSTASSSTNA
ncbi:DUF433 domain-containing protein [uncultured Alsobacter sp.]|uniref:DUF433 domain-containing protein n=1 Tax=uncultured Alsobacter sp. TaxID=1748258 RepID=UPI0025F81B15|nr:DUF433 domain-containing protein [uncultured Alsobacter sp.]